MAFPSWMRKVYGAKVGWSCEHCDRRFSDGWLIEVHHKQPTSSGGKDVFSNAECLCLQCHYDVHVKLAKDGLGHKNSPGIIKARIHRTNGGRTRKWIAAHNKRKLVPVS